MHQLIRASAGTGKTWRLSGHFLQQLFEGARPESILATTFTRKAAGEILGRVLLRLAEASQDPGRCAELADAMAPLEVTGQRASELLQQLTGQLHRLRVSTLDSFFQQIARSLTLELGLPPGWVIVDEYTDMTLRQRAIDAVLADQDTRDSRQLMQMLAKGRSRRSVRSLIDEAVEGYYELFLQTKPEAWDRIPRAATLPLSEQQLSMAELRSVPVAGKRQTTTRVADLERFQAANWTGFLSRGISGAICAGRAQYSRQDLSAELVDAYTPLVRHARAEVLNQISHRNLASRRLIARFHAAYERLRRDTGFTRFNEVTRLLAQSHSAIEGDQVNYRLDSSLRHLLLDEFQDTSLDQWNVLKRMVSPLVAPAAAQSSDEQSSVFCVGDPKQAIYGWRGGVAEIMDEVEAAIPGVEADTLDDSRRSAPAVIDTVNHVFKRLHHHKRLEEYEAACLEWSEAFPVHTTHRRNLPGFAEFRTSPAFDDDSEPDRRTAYQIWVAEQVREIHRTCPGAEIGVLMRTNGGVAQLVHQLTGLGVPASEEGGTPPTDSPAVLALLSLFYMASHPGCTASRYHVAHSPLADLVDFHAWEDDGAAMKTAAIVRCRLLDDGYGATVRWILEAVSDRCSDRDHLRLRQVLAEAWRFDGTPSLNPAEFVRLLETSRFSSTASAPVRVMTVHQSKGLEFEVVVAPELSGALMMVPAAASGGPNRAAAPEDVCVWTDRNLRHVLPQRLQLAFRQTIGDGVRGSLCLLYVTLTRAIHALHLLVPPETRTTRRTLAGLLAATFVDGEYLEEDSQIWATGDPDWYDKVPGTQKPRSHRPVVRGEVHFGVRLAEMPDGRRRGLMRRTPSDHAPVRLPFLSAGSSADQKQGVDPCARGTLIHAWFEHIRWLDSEPAPSDDALRKIADEPEIREWNIPDHAVDELIGEFRRMLNQSATHVALCESSVRQRFLRRLNLTDSDDLALDVMSERPFVFRHQGSIVQGTIDRLVVAKTAERMLAAEVIDYKTDRFFGDFEEWISLKRADYSSQLEDYRMAVAQCFGIPGASIFTSLLLLEADICVDVR